MVRVNASEYAEKWARRLKQATPDIKLGVERTTVNPADLAIASLDKMLAGFVEAMNSGKIEAGLRNVTLADWKDSMLRKGLSNLAAGVDGAQNKVTRKAGALLQAVDAAQGVVANMPDLTFEDRLNRMTAFSRSMHDATIE
jgi:hypothetical protein